MRELLLCNFRLHFPPYGPYTSRLVQIQYYHTLVTNYRYAYIQESSIVRYLER
jgi:hypothetical protein